MSRFTIVICNLCGQKLTGHRHWPRRRDLERLGWAVLEDDCHYCPECLESNISGKQSKRNGQASVRQQLKEGLCLQDLS